ncbi:hypothetical protein A5791_09205 [Mycobacterium sp. 852002-51163_SCH5372311]|uniref:DUF4232 domain-containing protein n=1 Tax=Mycobacterium sp. 852002-51163_SCH5372311 TaxID=1834097 RepID=UPI0008001ED8|nr:DUF4232 domain-containing protein [Mycobacterium sp. 852002-51163_SCH5372311]OBF80071.1 hypothetical protein A5791_09205 [Mycobacterium sp. 852002-51163_SCH5372311]
MRTTQAFLAAAVWLTVTATALGPAGAAHADPEIAPCDIQQLSVAAAPQQAGVGHRAVQLNFTVQPDVSACQLSGYPAVVALVPAGTQIQAKPTPQGYLGGGTPGTTATLVPGHGAHAMVEWVATGTPQDPDCRTYGSAPISVPLQVIPPGTWQTFDIPVSIGPNEGLCNLQVHLLTAD